MIIENYLIYYKRASRTRLRHRMNACIARPRAHPIKASATQTQYLRSDPRQHKKMLLLSKQAPTDQSCQIICPHTFNTTAIKQIGSICRLKRAKTRFRSHRLRLYHNSANLVIRRMTLAICEYKNVFQLNFIIGPFSPVFLFSSPLL